MQKVQPQALVDSGAEYSVVCEELILHVFGRLWLEETMTRPRQTTQFRLGDGQFASALGLVHFSIKLAGKEFLIHCWVFRQAAFDLILGAEFMVRHDLDVLMRAGCLHCSRDSFSAQFSGSRPRRDLYNSNGCVLQLRAENVVIKAGSEQLVWGRATSSDGTLSKAGTFGIISAVPSGPGSNQMLS